jgi:hypothetical protein
MWPPTAPLTILPPLLMKLPLPAVEVLLNRMMPAPAPPDPPTFVNLVRLPTVAQPANIIPPSPPAFPVFKKFCVFTLLLVIPVPLIVRKTAGFTVMLRVCVSEEVNVIPAMENGGLAETKRITTLEKLLNVAVFPALVPG